MLSMRTNTALILLSALVLAASCGPDQVPYLDKVRPLPADRAHPLVAQLIPLVAKPNTPDVDDLARTWKEFIGGAPLPLRENNAVTFVYYDFSKTLDQVFLETSFAPGRKEQLVRVAKSALFYRVFEVPKAQNLRYRFTDGITPLVDPFRSDVSPGGDQWHGPADLTQPLVEQVLGASEAGLVGQDITVVVPASYRRNLGWTYPLVLLVGLEGDHWVDEAVRLAQDKSVQQVVLMAVVGKRSTWTEADLRTTLEDRVVPWAKSHYRISSLPGDVYLTGWGPSAPAVKSVAAARPDFWPKVWQLNDGGLGPFLKIQLPQVAP